MNRGVYYHIERVCDCEDYKMVCVLFNSGHRCGYVGVPMGDPMYGKEADDCYEIECHGGITYADDHLDFMSSEDTWWIGFDCAHSGDGVDVDATVDYFGDVVIPFLEQASLGNMHSIWTCDAVIDECQSIVRQLRVIKEQD